MKINFYEDKKNENLKIPMTWLDWVSFFVVLTVIPVVYKTIQLIPIGLDLALKDFGLAISNIMMCSGTLFIAAGSIDGVGPEKPVFLGSSAIKLSIRVRESVPLFLGAYIIQFATIFGRDLILLSFGLIALGGMIILAIKKSWVIFAFFFGILISMISLAIFYPTL